MTTQPNALRLADLLAEYLGANHPAVRAISAELRRLHAERTAADGVVNDLAAKVRGLQTQRDALLSLLGSIRGWDMLDSTADGVYWKREIDAAIKAVEEGK